MAVVVEPIVTLEKLRALLDEHSEYSTLDYKSFLKLGKGNARDVVELAKDVAAMQAEPHGGYIVIGADDHGQPAPGLTPELAKHFDDATLRQKLGMYLTEPNTRSTQHEIDGHLFVLIYVAPNDIGWCIFNSPGEYEEEENGKKKKYVFQVGDVFIRRGTRSERWTDADRDRLVNQIIDRRKEQWRRERAEELAAQINFGLTVSTLAAMPASALSWQLDDDTFEQLVAELIRHDDDIPLRRLLTRASYDAAELLGKDQEELRRLLDRLTGFTALAIQYEREPWIERAIKTMVRIYALGFDESGHDRSTPEVMWLWLDIITRVHALGALAIRFQAWPIVKALADQRPEGSSFTHYGSWLRHALTTAAQAKIFNNEEKAGLLARAHNTIRTVPALCPDYSADQASILNSLCQFDVYGALIVIGEQGSTAGQNFYPSFARYDTSRSAPAFVEIVTNPIVRKTLFNGDDQHLADAITVVTSRARTEGFNYFGWTELDVPEVEAFITEHGTMRDFK